MNNDSKLVPEIYISYAWEKQDDGSNWPTILQNLYKILIDKGFKINIDLKNLKYKDNIKSFMQELGKGKYIVALISEKYLKSINCMYEVLQMLKYPNYQDRIFPILTSDAKIYESSKILEYLVYWEDKLNKLDNEARTLSNIAYAAPIFEDIELMNEIRRSLARFGNEIGNLNVLTPEIHKDSNFESLIESIEKKILIDNQTIDLKIENITLKEENLKLKQEIEDLREENISLQKKLLLKEKQELQKNYNIINTEKVSTEEIENIENFQINDFENFIGITRDTYLEDCIRKFGTPEITEEKKYDFNTASFNEWLIIRFYKSSRKVMVIDIRIRLSEIQSTIEKLNNLEMFDSKICFLGKHRNELLKIFGNPDYQHAGNYSYKGNNSNINFVCYDFNDSLCTQMTVQFLGNE
ncbi:MAG: toll/interleukin-1 receptor domain-containing protein [Candidatus Azobacteroides sp.]|nr:toll/interleukin-1 receptor domain-containing protein [Candidatus Azobacteroides sp.]